jgi:aryl-alcohol dehydrogenase-like predicted oxidoreductase
MMALCADQGLGYTPFSPLAGGFLTGKYGLEQPYPEGSRMTLRPEPYLDMWNETTFARLDRLRDEAGSRDVSMAGLALAWVMRHPGVTAPVVGPRRPSHFEPVVEAMALDLSPSDHAAIAAIFEGG